MAEFEWLTRHEAAKRLGVSPNTLKSRRSRGLIESKHDRDGRLVFKVPKDDEAPDLDHWQAVKDLAKPQLAIWHPFDALVFQVQQRWHIQRTVECWQG